MINVMRVDLAAQLRAVEHGQFTAPAGEAFVRRGTKTKRRVCDEAITQGSPWFCTTGLVANWSGSTATTPAVSGPRFVDR
jgi:hypothetical protein